MRISFPNFDKCIRLFLTSVSELIFVNTPLISVLCMILFEFIFITTGKPIFLESATARFRLDKIDLGTFIPVVPLMIRKIGASVEDVEKFSLYGGAFHSIVNLLKEEGIIVHNLDIINDDISKKFMNNYYDFDIFNVTDNHPKIGRLWSGAYKTVNQANVIFSIIDNITEGSNTEAIVGAKELALGQAHYLRALSYFNFCI